MSRILRVDASARVDRSLSRGLGDTFMNQWQRARPEGQVVSRDVGQAPPRPVSATWIRAAFKHAGDRSEEERNVLQESDVLISELEQADVVLITSPMYNYGPPAALKAWIDQVVRVNKTFTFDLSRGDWPLAPILSGKILVALTSTGEFGFEEGGMRSHMNHLLPHLRTVKHYLGAEHLHHVGIEYQEFGDARHERSLEAAHQAASELAVKLAGAVRERAL